MSEKQQMIKKMLEMQHKFVQYDQEKGVSMGEYFTPPDGSPIKDYRQEYRDLAMKVVELAHNEKGSHA